MFSQYYLFAAFGHQGSVVDENFTESGGFDPDGLTLFNWDVTTFFFSDKNEEVLIFLKSMACLKIMPPMQTACILESARQQVDQQGLGHTESRPVRITHTYTTLTHTYTHTHSHIHIHTHTHTYLSTNLHSLI